MRSPSFSRVLVAVTLLFGVATAGAQDLIPNVPLIRDPHPPIVIRNNSEFLLPLNGVRAGSGSAADPYVISGWEINIALWTYNGSLSSVPNNGIDIQNTTAHVIISDNLISNGSGTGVLLRNAPNVRIVGNQFDGMTNVVDARNIVGKIEIVDNNWSSGNGLRLISIAGPVTITGNASTASSSWAVNLESIGTGPVLVNQNVFRRGRSAVIQLKGVSTGANAVQINRNSVTGSGAGTTLSQPNALDWVGIALRSVSGSSFTVEDNLITENRDGLLLQSASPEVRGNCFTSNLIGINLKAGTAGTLINNNDFEPNVHLAIMNDNAAQPLINATGNWWGKAAGPNQFDGAPERTYGNLNTSSPAPAAVAVNCGT